ILHKTPTPPARLNPELPAALEQIIQRATEKDRDLRYKTASELQADLARLRRELDSAPAAAPTAAYLVQPATRRRLIPAVVMTAIVLGSVMGSVMYWQHGRRDKARQIQTVLAGLQELVDAGQLDEVFDRLSTTKLDLNDPRLEGLA